MAPIRVNTTVDIHETVVNIVYFIGKFGDLDIDVHNVYKVELPTKLFDSMKVRIVVFNDREDANTLPATSGQWLLDKLNVDIVQFGFDKCCERSANARKPNDFDPICKHRAT